VSKNFEAFPYSSFAKRLSKPSSAQHSFTRNSCRVIQKALLVLDQASVCKIITELQDIEEVIPFIFDPNGNHVIQRAIQIMSNFAKSAADHGDIDAAVNLMHQIKFIIDDVAANVEQLSKHRYGCRVVQRAIEYCPDEQRDEVLMKILACHRNLIEDQFGNYVIQQALTIGSEEIITAIVESLTEGDVIFKFSKHKYASNVVEAMLTSATAHHKEAILSAMLKVSVVLAGWCYTLLIFLSNFDCLTWLYSGFRGNLRYCPACKGSYSQLRCQKNN
jgi:pumilio RNA-binding family